MAGPKLPGRQVVGDGTALALVELAADLVSSLQSPSSEGL